MGYVDTPLYKCKCFIHAPETVTKPPNQNNIPFLLSYTVDEELFCHILSFYHITKWVLSST